MSHSARTRVRDHARRPSPPWPLAQEAKAGQHGGGGPGDTATSDVNVPGRLPLAALASVGVVMAILLNLERNSLLIKVLAYAFVLALSGLYVSGRRSLSMERLMCVWCAIYIFMPLGNVLWMSLTPLEDLIAMSRLFLDGPLRALAALTSLLLGTAHASMPLASRAKHGVGALFCVLYCVVSGVLYARTGDAHLALRHIGTLPVQFCLGCAIAQIACCRR